MNRNLTALLAILSLTGSAKALTFTINTDLPTDATFFNSYIGDTGSVFDELQTPLGDFWGDGVIYAPGTSIPGIAASTAPGAAFMAVTGNENLELFGMDTSFSILWGSADTWNNLELVNTVINTSTFVSGAVINGVKGTAPYWVTITDAPAFNEIQFHSTQPAFEFSLESPVTPPAAPEISTWLMIAIGFASIGWASLRRSVRLA